jgi:phosphoglycolate phosphatase-like HAD superfamily hydrolase
MLYLFDLDGTLMTSSGSGGRAFERACQEVLGIPQALEKITLHGNTDPSILDEACRHARGTPATAGEREAVFAAYLGHLAGELAAAEVEVLPGVRELLDLLENRRDLVGLATGNLFDGARLKLTAAGLWGRFPVGGYGSDAAERADLVRVAIQRAEGRLGRPLDRSEIALIGDTPRDVAAARENGVRAIAVATGMHDTATLADAGADEVHETLATFEG